MRIIWDKKFMLQADNANDFLSDKLFREGAAEGLRRVTDAPDATSEFFENVRSNLLKSLELDSEEPLKPAIFVLVAVPRQIASLYGTPAKIHDVELQGSNQWAGKLIFAAKHGTAGWAVPLIGNSVPDTIQAILAKSHGEHPAAVFYPEKRIISCAANGLAADSPSVRLSLPKNARELTMDELKRVMELVRQEGLITPSVCPPNVWSVPANYIPATETETQLQWCLAAEMRGYFRPLLVEREQVVSVGRIDICFTDLNAYGPEERHPAVVEVKVLRSYGSGKSPISEQTNIFALIRGMGQAKSYRVKKQAKLGALACFDLRKVKAPIIEHEAVQKATERYYDDRMATVMLPLYGIAEDAQDEIAAAS